MTERKEAPGNVLKKLDETRMAEAVRDLRDAGCEALVIHFLHAYANPAHEIRAAEIAAELWPNDYITMGHSLLSETREFERGVTAAVNASVQPLLERYVARLREELAGKGYRGDVLVMNGNGGMVSSRLVAREAAKTVMSGPASGVMAAAYTGRRAGELNLLTYDMGGTSTDVALIRDGTPPISNEIEIEYAMPIHVPMVDVRTVGAGGGSIAVVDAAGLLQVGPASAGADPGPICYGKGGTEPTISDANMLLGRLNPDKLNAVAGGVSNDQIAQIFKDKLGTPLGVDATQGAEAVIRIANAKMAGAIRMVSLSLGADPRDFALFAIGGAGHLKEEELAREHGVPRVIDTARPGLTYALGCVVADLRLDYVQTINQLLGADAVARVETVFADQLSAGKAALARESVTMNDIHKTFSVDMQFLGQSHVVRVPLGTATPTEHELRSGFETVYWNLFKVALPEIQARIVNVNTSVVGVRNPVDLSRLIDPENQGQSVVPTGHRQVVFDGTAHQTPIYWRDHLPPDAALSGPAIIEQLDTTVLLPPGDQVTSGADGNLIIHIGGAA